MTEFCTVLITAGSEQEAADIARSLVDARLAACCSVLPGIRSVYRWEGTVQNDSECMIIAKSAKALFSQLEEHVRRIHSYDVPEILCLPIEQGSGSYLQWLGNELQQDDGK